MAIRKLADGRYQVQVDVGRKPDGRRDRPSRICGTKREAERVEADLRARRAVNGGVSGRVRLDWFVDNVWRPEKLPICAHSTMRAYDSHLRCHILPALGSLDVCDIRHVDVQRMLSSCATRKVAQNARSTLYNVLQMAVDLGIAPRNAAASRGFRLPREKGRIGGNHGEWLTSFPEHVRVIEEARGTPAFPIVVLGLCFGLRMGEVLGLDWEHVDLDAGVIHVVQTYVRADGGPALLPPKTPSSVRDIPVTPTARRYLLELGPSTGAVARSTTGSRMTPSGANKAMARFTSSRDVPRLTVLSLRHSFATSAIRAGINVASVSAWLGHASVATTLDRYVKPLQSDLRADVADVVEGLYGG